MAGCAWLFSKSLLRQAGTTIALVLFYYTFSITLTFYNRAIIKNFKIPLFLTVIHLVVKFILASWVRSCMYCYSKERRVILPWPVYVKTMALTGLASVMDIGLSNWSLEFITISLYTMTKTSVIVFVLIFALCLRLEKFHCCQLVTVLFIAIGLFLFTFESTQFNEKGFALALFASFSSGLRWGLMQKVGQKKELGLGNPVDFMYHIQPWMLVGLIPAAFALDGKHLAMSEDFFAFTDGLVFARNGGLVLIGALVAFGLEFSEFLLVLKTSSLTLSIAGIVKELLLIFLAEELNGDRMTAINSIGLVACIAGICIHVGMKAQAHHSKSPGESDPVSSDAQELNMLIGDTEEDKETSEEEEL